MFYTDDSVVVRKFKVTNGEFYLVNATSSVGLGVTSLFNQMTQIKQLYMYVCTFI